MSRLVTAMVASMLALAACTGSSGESEVPSTVPSDGASPPASSEASASNPSGETPSPSADHSPVPTASPAPEARWSELDASGPTAREDHTWTVSGDGDTAFLFGGRDGATVHGDLWSFELGTDRWRRIEVPGGPSPRFGHEAVWMDGIGVVIFAGQAGPTFFDDLWAFDPESTTWRQLPSRGTPPTPRYGSCASVGPDGHLWISHGFTSDGTRFADTRRWDPSSGAWADETPDETLPVSRCLHGCWWTDDGALALFGGQTTGVTALDDRWRFREGSWSRVEGSQPAARNLYARARHGAGTVVFGGQGVDGGYLADAWWLLDADEDARPVAVVGEAVPAGRSGAELIVDASRGRLLLFGGRDDSGAFADTWQLDGVPPAAP